MISPQTYHYLLPVSSHFCIAKDNTHENFSDNLYKLYGFTVGFLF